MKRGRKIRAFFLQHLQYCVQKSCYNTTMRPVFSVFIIISFHPILLQRQATLTLCLPMGEALTWRQLEKINSMHLRQADCARGGREDLRLVQIMQKRSRAEDRHDGKQIKIIYEP